MKNRITLLCILFCLLTLPLAGQTNGLFVPSPTVPKHEVRGVWLTTLSGLDWPKKKATSAKEREAQKAELCRILDQYRECRINTVFLQTRVRGSLLYPGGMEPCDVALTGKFDTEPGYDPLEYAIQETHRRGMELHAWVVSIPCFKVAQAPRVGKKSLYKKNKSLLKKHADTYYLDPGLPETATYLTDICTEITRRYDIDGIHLDYIRYPEKASTFPDAGTYRKYGKGQNKEEWRRGNITSIVRQIYHSVKALKPWVRVSCSPVGKYRDVTRFSAQGWNAYDAVNQDAQGWLKEGIMDMLCPMMYFQGNHFYPFAANWQEESHGRSVVPGLGIYFLHPEQKDWEWGVVQRELCFIREQGLSGQAYFRSQFLTEDTKGIMQYLKESYYPYPALLPAMTWQSSTKPSAPQVLKREQMGGTMERITWTAAEKPEGGLRYVLYADTTQAVNIGEPRNIIKVTSDTTFTYNQLTHKLYGYHLAITALDRYGNESAPLLLDSIAPKTTNTAAK